MRCYSKCVLELWEPDGNNLETCWEHSGNTLGTEEKQCPPQPAPPNPKPMLLLHDTYDFM